jgi:hypothetical protein
MSLDGGPGRAHRGGMGKTIACWLGRHDWQHRRNEEMGGKDADYQVCRRCGAERKEYGPPSPNAAGVGGGWG